MKITESYAEIVELPALLTVDGKTIFTPDFSKMSDTELRILATGIQARVIWVKMRAVYTMPEQTFCIARNCYALADAGSIRCRSHP